MLTPEQRQVLEVLAKGRWFYASELGSTRWAATGGWRRLEELIEVGFVELREIAGSREYRITPAGRKALEAEAG